MALNKAERGRENNMNGRDGEKVRQSYLVCLLLYLPTLYREKVRQ